MNEHASLADITFTENGYVDVSQPNALYRRTESETTEMLRVSHYYIAGHTAEGTLVGFARVCGDPYLAQVLDVITHPNYRRRGIATRCMRGVLAHLQHSRYVSATLTDGSGIAGFYQGSDFGSAKMSHRDGSEERRTSVQRRTARKGPSRCCLVRRTEGKTGQRKTKAQR